MKYVRVCSILLGVLLGGCSDDEGVSGVDQTEEGAYSVSLPDIAENRTVETENPLSIQIASASQATVTVPTSATVGTVLTVTADNGTSTGTIAEITTRLSLLPGVG